MQAEGDVIRFPEPTVAPVDFREKLPVRVETDWNGPQWTSNTTLLVNRYDQRHDPGRAGAVSASRLSWRPPGDLTAEVPSRLVRVYMRLVVR